MENTRTYNPLYKMDVSGNTRVWQLELGWKDNYHASFRSISGLKDGKKVVSEWKVCEPKNVGRSNATNALEQAISEIESLYKIRKERGYFENENDILKFDKFSPMLASSYDKERNKISFDEVIYSQPKLDGIRCIANIDGLWTRTGKEIVSCPHIWKNVQSIFDQYPDLVLDGELYNHDLKDDFNKITSLVRKTKPKDIDIQEAETLVQYHVYDCKDSSEKEFKSRKDFIQNLCSSMGYLHFVKTDRAMDQEHLDHLYSDYLEKGYEGQMIRKNSLYENKRSKLLIKRKEFLSDEFKVIAIEEGKGNWAGYVKRFILELPDGRVFGSGVRGSQKAMKDLLECGNTPSWATLRYFTPTPDGIPRFPVVVDWGFGTRED